MENQCLDLISKNILQESFNQKEFSIKAQEAQQEQKEANISQMISEPLEDSDLNEESLLLDPSLLGFGSEDFSLDSPPELVTWCQNMLHDFLNDQRNHSISRINLIKVKILIIAHVFHRQQSATWLKGQ
ncbi:heat shock protein [Biomphalaria glabrata]|nr:heat shock protein [Biomphalaria glabrata]